MTRPTPPSNYSALPPLSFEDLPYVGPDGNPWPQERIELPRTARTYGSSAPLRVACVELNAHARGRTLVFIHGLGSYLKFWRYQLDAFAAEGHRVLALDLPGFGKSDKPAEFPYSSEALADAVHELLELRGVPAPVLVGHSLGGQTALAIALRHPDAVGALALTAPAGFELFTPEEKVLLQRATTAQAVMGAAEADVWRLVRDANFQRWRPELEWLIEERVRLAKTPEFAAYAHAQVKCVEGLTRNDWVRDSLGRVEVPTLILFGSDDRLIPNPFLHPGRTRDLMAFGQVSIRGSTLVELDGCGHAVQLDAPDDCNAALRRFLESLSAERPHLSVATS